ncbi:cyanophycinase [Parasphingopyxis algicola]|uniref:cyanophycinase n=1 Tax=Parasphingopyxis algicola TaxID=2026624 RepID=UPI0015A00F3A|nr:cyanophycinase [Parasphingopyxis algicola]QLC24698.1 cyanophycinase [Parasphingopyxis algicola]
MIRWLVLAAIALAALLPAAAPANTGKLLIVGGGLGLENEAVYRALIDSRPADAPTIAIISAAASDPHGRAATFAGELMFHGIEPDEIVIVRLASVDDPETPDIDESDWVANAANPEEIAKIESAGAIWLTDGDPLRLTQALVRPGGFDSPMLMAIRDRLRAGVIVGGIGAGAAAMSSPMIANGEAFDALFGLVTNETTDGAEEGEDDLQPLVLPQGLRLFSPFTIDTEFGQRGRLGLLARAILEQPEAARIGLGIDSGTALLVDFETASAQVLGIGAVTLLDGRRAQRTVSISGFLIRGLRLSRLHDGDRLSLTDLEVRPDPARLAVEDRQRAFGAIWPSAESLAVLESEQRTLQVSERYLRGNARIDVRLEDRKRSAEFRFIGGRDSRYFRRLDDEGWAGTLTGISLSIDGHVSPVP